jgi:ABC-2 type transport system permease protein
VTHHTTAGRTAAKRPTAAASTVAGPAATDREVALPGTARLIAHQFRYDVRAFSRNGQARFFTLALPVAFLLIFATVFRDKTVPVPGGLIHTSVYYVPGIIALGIIQAAVSNLALSVTTQRESGILKRRRATPVSAGVLITARALTAATVALVMTALLAAIGWFAYSAHIQASHAAALVVTVLAGAASFAAIGFALTTLIRSADSAQPTLAAITLPLYFISGIFLATTLLPHWLLNVAGVFPVRPFQQALLTAYNPYSAGSGFATRDLLIMAAWGAAGLLIAIRRFRWTPQSA